MAPRGCTRSRSSSRRNQRGSRRYFASPARTHSERHFAFSDGLAILNETRTNIAAHATRLRLSKCSSTTCGSDASTRTTAGGDRRLEVRIDAAQPAEPLASANGCGSWRFLDRRASWTNARNAQLQSVRVAAPEMAGRSRFRCTVAEILGAGWSDCEQRCEGRWRSRRMIHASACLTAPGTSRHWYRSTNPRSGAGSRRRCPAGIPSRTARKAPPRAR